MVPSNYMSVWIFHNFLLFWYHDITKFFFFTFAAKTQEMLLWQHEKFQSFPQKENKAQQIMYLLNHKFHNEIEHFLCKLDCIP